MIKNYTDFMTRLQQIKDEMKMLGISSIDLDYGLGGVTEAKVVDAEAYSVIRRTFEPQGDDAFKTFHIDGWLQLTYHDFNGKAEAEIKASGENNYSPF